VIRRQGRDDLAAELSINDLIEVEKTEELDQKEIWYIRLGLNNEVPQALYNIWRDDLIHVFPTKSISRRKVTVFVTTQLVETIHDSPLLDKLLTSTYDDTVGHKVGDDMVEEKLREELGEELEANEEVVYDQYTVKGGNVTSADEFPLMHTFKIHVDNM